jgi:hypothetical protein
MNKRHRRIQRIAAVLQEYLAAESASELLAAETDADPSYGEARGWEPRAGVSFSRNLNATYLIRMYAEFEAGLRDYWRTHLGHATHPAMRQLVCHAIPNERFSQDCVDNADEVRIFRNFMVHNLDEDPPEETRELTLAEAKRRLCTYFSRLDPRWG